MAKSITPNDIKEYLKTFIPIREALNNNKPAETVATLFDNIPNNTLFTYPGISILTQIAQILIQTPIIFMKLLMTLIYLQTFGGKITNVISKQVQELYSNDDNQTLKKSVPEFSFDPSVNVIDTAATWFNVVARNWNGSTKPFLSDMIDKYVSIANIIIGEGVGDRARIAAENAVWASSAATLITFMGCQNNLIQVSPTDCNLIEKSVEDLLNPILNELQ